MEIKNEKMMNEQQLSSLIFQESWTEAAFKAFDLGKKRDLAFILNQMLKQESNNDPIDTVLQSLDDFESQFGNSTPKSKKRENKLSQFGELVKELVEKNALEVFNLLKIYSTSKHAILAHHILHQIFKFYSVQKFIQMCQDFSKNQLTNEDEETKKKKSKTRDWIWEWMLKLKPTVKDVTNIVDILSFYSNKHYQRLDW